MYDTRVTFKGFGSDQSSAHLEDYLSDLVGTTVESFLPKENFILDLKVHHDTLHNNHKNKKFDCEVILRILGEKRPIVVRKGDANFYRSALACAQALRNILTRRTRVRAQVRRHSRWENVAS